MSKSKKALEEQNNDFEDKYLTNSDNYYQEGKSFLETPNPVCPESFKLIPSTKGQFCFHSVYIWIKADNFSLPDKGYNIPNDLMVLKEITHSSSDDFYRQLLVKKVGMMMGQISINGITVSEPFKKFWSHLLADSPPMNSGLFAKGFKILKANEAESAKTHKFFDGVLLNGKDNNFHFDNPEDDVANPVDLKWGFPSKDELDSRNLAMKKGILKWIPQESWFNEEINKVEAKDLLTILPPSERNMFMIILGRIMVGRNNSYTYNGTKISHTFRSLAIMIGKEAGLGKSTLMNFINNALSHCGYEVSVIPNTSSQFNWSKPATADLAYNDDLTIKSQKHLLGNELIKSLTSNGMVSTQDKGVDAVTVNSKCVIICNSNSYDPSDLYDSDAGIKSRAKLLLTYTLLELSQVKLTGVSKGSPDLRTYEHWEYLSRKLNTSPLVLAMKLLQLSASYFLKLTGYYPIPFKKPFNYLADGWQRSLTGFDTFQYFNDSKSPFKEFTTQEFLEHHKVKISPSLKAVVEEAEKFYKVDWKKVSKIKNSTLENEIKTLSRQLRVDAQKEKEFPLINLFGLIMAYSSVNSKNYLLQLVFEEDTDTVRDMVNEIDFHNEILNGDFSSTFINFMILYSTSTKLKNNPINNEDDFISFKNNLTSTKNYLAKINFGALEKEWSSNSNLKEYYQGLLDFCPSYKQVKVLLSKNDSLRNSGNALNLLNSCLELWNTKEGVSLSTSKHELASLIPKIKESTIQFVNLINEGTNKSLVS